MDPGHHQPTVDTGDDEQDWVSIPEFLDLELSPEDFPVSNMLQKMIAEMLSHDEAEDDAVATALVNLEAELVNMRAALTNARTTSLKLAVYAINLEVRLIAEGIPSRLAQEEMAALCSRFAAGPHLVSG